jgi:hypothetical protein
LSSAKKEQLRPQDDKNVTSSVGSSEKSQKKQAGNPQQDRN